MTPTQGEREIHRYRPENAVGLVAESNLKLMSEPARVAAWVGAHIATPALPAC
jgi:hypothetical protein